MILLRKTNIKFLCLAFSLAVSVTSQTFLGLLIVQAAEDNSVELAGESAPVQEVVELGYTKTVITSAYYSPLPGQSYYATGSYETDIRLNGNGTNGADGTPVFPGMIAAPPEYSFGTKINIPGIGITSVHDRGGAIKSAGQRGNAHDRLDIWMGHGDEGLRQALQWGKRTVDVFIYYPETDVDTKVYFTVVDPIQNFVQNTILKPLHFPNDLYYGTENADVKRMQEYLVTWNYLEEAGGFYGEETAEAIFLLQIDYDLIDSAEELGAGHFGPATRKLFENLINNGPDEKSSILQRGRLLMEKHSDLKESDFNFGRALSKGDSGADVARLQDELRVLGFLRVESSSHFDDLTAHALAKFQQKHNLILDLNDSAAGYLGPKTRETLNGILKKRVNMKSAMAYQREEISEGRHLVRLPYASIAAQKEDDALTEF